MGERLARIQEVRGSIPLVSTSEMQEPLGLKAFAVPAFMLTGDSVGDTRLLLGIQNRHLLSANIKDKPILLGLSLFRLWLFNFSLIKHGLHYGGGFLLRRLD